MVVPNLHPDAYTPNPHPSLDPDHAAKLVMVVVASGIKEMASHDRAWTKVNETVKGKCEDNGDKVNAKVKVIGKVNADAKLKITVMVKVPVEVKIKVKVKVMGTQKGKVRVTCA